MHDSDGYPVSGATIAVRLHGSAAGSATTSADGTFAVDTPEGADTVDVRCAYCVPASIPHAPGQNVVAVVRRFAVLRDRGISAADIRVLPYDTVGGIAALVPFTVTSRSSISDRGLAGSRGTILTDGIPLYRATDGVDLGAALPPHGAATLAQTDPIHANSYAARSSGGLFSIDTLDLAGGIARIDNNAGISATLRGGNVVRGSFVTAGGEYPSTRLTGAAGFTIGTGSLDVRAVATSAAGSAGAAGANAIGFVTTFAQPIRTWSLSGSLALNRSAGPAGPENDSAASIALQHGGITYGVRGMRSSGSVQSGDGVQFDARAYIEATSDNGHVKLFGSLAVAQSGDTIARYKTQLGALLPIASVTVKLGDAFAVHADSVDALLAPPLYVLDGQPYSTSIQRSRLLDAGLTYDDRRRVRIDLTAFRETSTGATAETLGGSGISAIWQIAPAVALRTWIMISRENTVGTPLYPIAVRTAAYPATASVYDRNSIWLTVGNTFRADVISHGGRLEGDVSFPLGSQLRAIAGTRRDGPARLITLGLQLP